VEGAGECLVVDRFKFRERKKLMKKSVKKLIAAAVMVTVLAVALAACGEKDTYDYRANLPGNYVVSHWFYDIKDGESGFYEEEAKYSFGEDGTFSCSGGVNEGEVTGTYEFTGDNTITITYSDGSFDEMTLRYSSNHDTIEMTNNETKYAVSLEAAD